MAQPAEAGSLNRVGVAALEEWSQHSITHKVRTISHSPVKEKKLCKARSEKKLFFKTVVLGALSICTQAVVKN